MQKVARYLAALALVAAVAVGVGLLVDGGDEGQAPPKHERVTVPLPGPDQTLTIDHDNQLGPAQQREDRTLRPGGAPATAPGLDLHEDMRDETPAGVTKQEVQQGMHRAAEIDAHAPLSTQLRPPREPAGAQAYSCPAAHVVNQSALNSRRYGVAMHFTVSPPGSLLSVRGMFNRPSFGASSNYGFELFNLRCQEWVPITRKAWAQGAFNSAYVSIEIVSYDRSRADWLNTPAFKYGVLAGLVRDLLKRTGAPARLVDPSGCTPLAGITDHDRLECGNSHWDVGTHFPWDVFLRQVRQGTTTTTASVLTKYERGIARKRCYHRAQHLAGHNTAANLKWARVYVRKIAVRRAQLRGLGLTTKAHRKLRHRVLGGYANAKACR